MNSRKRRCPSAASSWYSSTTAPMIVRASCPGDLSTVKFETGGAEVTEAAIKPLEDGKAPGGVLYRRYAALNEWRRPRKLGGSVLWLILLWALAWIVIALVGAGLINPVLESIDRLR